MALFSLYLISDILIFEKKTDNFALNSFNTEHQYSTTTHSSSSVDNCEPLYILIYIHCCVWFIFLVSPK